MSSLRARSLAVVLAAILPSLVLIVFHIARERLAETAEATKEMQALARAAALDTERSVEHAQQLLVVVSSTHAVRGGDPLRCDALLSDLASRFPEYAYLAVARVDGGVFCGAPRANTPARLDVGRESYVTRALESRGFAVGDIVLDLLGGPASLPVAQAILDEKGAATGAVLAGVSLEWLDRWASKVSLPPESTVALVDAGGTVLARYPPALQQIGHPLQPTGLANAVLEGQQDGSKESGNPAGEPYLYVFTHVGSRVHELHVIVGRPRAMVLAEANRDLAGELIALALFAAVASAAGWVGTERLLLPPIRALITAAGRLGGGDLTSRTGLSHGRDEVGRLAAAYDGMAQALEIRERLRSAAAAELTREKELLETILEHIPVMICFISRSGKIEWINHAFQRVLGWSLKEAGSRDILSDSYPDPAAREEVLRYILDPPPGWRDFRTRTKDGRVLDTSWANVVLSDGSGIGFGQDISDRKEAEEQLRRARDEYRRLFDNAPVGIFRSTPEGGLLAANEAMARIFGFRSPEELRARFRDIRDLHASPGQGEDLSQTLLERGIVMGLELRAQRAGGEEIWVSVSAQALHDPDGSVVALEGTVEDITDRKNARRAVEDSRHRLQALFDNTLDALLLADDEGRFIDANPAACVLLGYERSELLRMSVSDIRPARHRDEGTVAWQQFLAIGNLTGEYACLRKDGTTREVEFRSVANVVPGVHLSALRDVTPRKVAEARIRRQSEIIDQIHDSVVSCDLEGYVTGWNKGAERIFGYTSEQALGRHISFLNNPDDQPPQALLIGQLLERGAIDLERRPTTRGGEPIDIHVSLSLLRDDAGLPAGMVGYSLDITQRKKVERALTARNEQQAAVARLGQAALTGLDVQELFDHAARTAADTLGAEYSQILELLPGGQEMLLRAGVGWGDGGRLGTTRVQAGLGSQACYILSSGEPLVTEDLLSETRFTASPLLRDHRVASGVSVAIGGSQQAFGVLGVHTTRPRAFSKDDVHFLQGVAHVLASALLHKRAEEERTSLLRRLISAQDDERRRTARELHDEAGQALTGVLVGLRRVQAATTLAKAKAGARGLRKITSRAVTDVGRLARGLHPSVLDDMGLVAAVRRYVAEYTRLHGLKVTVNADARVLSQRLPSALEVTLYRVVQEALTNVARHAHAKCIEIVICDGETAVDLIVRDDGSGFDPNSLVGSAARGRLGLIGMRERIALLGGSMSLDSCPGAGTTVAVRVPRHGG
jgi:PAS domain S-box-containing protein